MIDKVEVTTKDEKYQLYLPAILNSWLGVKLLYQKEKASIQKISDIRNSKDKMTGLYFSSKKNNIPYLQYIVNHRF